MRLALASCLLRWAVAAAAIGACGAAASAGTVQPTQGSLPSTPVQRLAAASEAQQLFDEACALEAKDPTAAQERFEASARLYQRIADSGVRNGQLQYNLGNAYAKAGDASRAIVSYLAAERLLPGNPDVADALSHARAMTGIALGPASGATALDRAARAWAPVPLDVRTWLAIGAWLAVWGTVAAGILTGWTARVPWRSAIAVVAMIGILPAVTVGVDVLRTSLDRPGVLVGDAVVLRKGNGDGFSPAVAETLRSGSEFVMLEERPGWLRIRLPSGQTGWIRQADALVCRD